MYCSMFYCLQKLFISTAFVITLFHINFSGIWFSILFVSLLFFVLRYIEDYLVFPVNVPSESRWCVPLPSLYQLPYEELSIRTDDGEELSAYLILQQHQIRSNVPTLVFCHGNAGNMGQRLLNCAQLYRFCQTNILIFDYRGYGRSSGTPSEGGFYTDVQSVINFLKGRTDIDTNNIVIFGRSIGGAVAIEAAVRNSSSGCIAAIILENTFTSIPEIAKHLIKIPFITSLPFFLLRNQFESVKKIDRMSVPALFLSGDKDTFVPPAMMMELYSKCPPLHKTMNRISNGDHNNTWTRPGYFEAINIFLKTLQPRQADVFVTTVK